MPLFWFDNPLLEHFLFLKYILNFIVLLFQRMDKSQIVRIMRRNIKKGL
jgi:hypothetical protein